jgi:hypothetical protein
MNRNYYFVGGFLTIALSQIFYLLQNHYLENIGGKIAYVKALWLFVAIFYWFVLPAIIVFSQQTSRAIKIIYSALLISMVLRGVIEIFMMYVFNNWHPYLGMSHNLITFILVIIFILKTSQLVAEDRVFIANIVISILMLIPESFFAWYMLHNLNAIAHRIYFVPQEEKYNLIMLITWFLVILLFIWQIIFSRKLLKKSPYDQA